MAGQPTSGTSPGSFAFLAELPDAEAKAWLRAFLQGRELPPHAGRADVRPAADLASALAQPAAAALREQVGALAADMLGDAVEGALFVHPDAATADYLAALFALLEWAPHPRTGDALEGLVLSHRLRGQASERGDLHLLALRALVANQRVPPRGTPSWVASLWRPDLHARAYGPVVLQGLLAVDAATAMAELPAALAAWLAADPAVPLANTLFVLREALGDDAAPWQALAAHLPAEPAAAPALLAAASELGWQERFPAAWQALRGAASRRTRSKQPRAHVFGTAHLRASDAPLLPAGRARLIEPRLLPAAA